MRPGQDSSPGRQPFQPDHLFAVRSPMHPEVPVDHRFRLVGSNPPPHALAWRPYVGQHERLRLTLGDLVQLHGWELLSSGTRPLLPATALALARALPRHAEQLKDWRKQALAVLVDSLVGRPRPANLTSR